MNLPLYVITSQDILIIIALIISAITLVLVLILLLRKKESSGLDEKNIIQRSINKEMLDLSSRLHSTLMENMTKEKDSITELRLELNKELDAFKERLGENLKKEFKGLSETVDIRMNRINDKVEERLSEGFKSTNETFINIQKSMSAMSKAQENIEGLSKEMISLQDILTNNQQRGAFGEYQLQQILYATFGENPKLYALQHDIQKGTEKVRADSVIFMPDGLVCIDSKFPYSGYRKLFEEHLSKEEEREALKTLKVAIKKHIDDIANKYIVPNVTTDFAVMFLPSDGLLALIHLRLGELIEYANNKKVVIVSPTTIIPLIASYRIVKIDHDRSKYAKEIGDQLAQLSKEFTRFGKRWGELSHTINKLSEEGEEVNKTVRKLTTKFDRLNTSDIASIAETENKDA